MNETVSENEYIKLWTEDEILVCQYKKNSIITLDAAKQIVKFRLEYQKGKRYKVLCYAGHISVITPDARHYLANEGYEGVEKIAIVVINTNPFTALLGNLFIRINKPLSPTRLFKSKEEGMKWLRERG